MPASGDTKTFSWSPDGKWLLVGRSTNKMNEATPSWKVYETSNWKASGDLPRNAVVKWSPDSRRLVAGGRLGEMATGQFFLFEIPSRKQITLGAAPEASSLAAVAWSPDGQRIVTGSGLGAVRVCEVSTGALGLSFNCPRRVAAVAWSNDGRVFAADAEGIVKVWDPAAKKEVLNWTVDVPKLQRPTDAQAWKLRFSPDARFLAAVSPEEPPPIMTDPLGKPLGVVNPEGIHLWDMATGKFLSKLNVNGRLLTWHPDGCAVVICDNRNYTRTWDVTKGKEIATFYKPDDAVSPIAAAWSPDGRRLAFTTGTLIKVHDAVTGQEVLTLHQRASVLAWSPDRWRLAAQFAVKRIDWTDARPAVAIWNATPSDR
jgi:WD40 repeat protein